MYNSTFVCAHMSDRDTDLLHVSFLLPVLLINSCCLTFNLNYISLNSVCHTKPTVPCSMTFFYLQGLWNLLVILKKLIYVKINKRVSSCNLLMHTPVKIYSNGKKFFIPCKFPLVLMWRNQASNAPPWVTKGNRNELRMMKSILKS